MKTVSVVSIICMCFSCVVGFGLPIGLLFYFKLRKKADIKPFFIGCAVMLLFAFVLERAIHYFVFQSSFGNMLYENTWALAIYGGLMAGVFEETGRLLAFKTVLKKNMDKPYNALMYGAGHGGFEAIVLLGLTMVSNLITSFMINTGAYEALVDTTSDATVKSSLETTMNVLVSTPSMDFLYGGVERISAIIIQISLSIMVWFAAKNAKDWYFYFVAIGLHTFVDAMTVVQSTKLTDTYQIELQVFAYAMIVFGVAKRLWNRRVPIENPDVDSYDTYEG